MVFYRKYRPQTLDDLVGQDSVKKILTDAQREGKLAHAYLFVGPRGTGKTSTARILAKMINCEKDLNGFPGRSGMTVEIPCNKCDSCKSITDGSNLDLIEIDAASNRGIDDIRTLRENIKLAPTSSKKKVYIIDEVHMLTTEAFNALLKTLEEPPQHCLFILATTEVSKLPQTILSRVQRLDFKLASMKDVTIALKKITEAEKLKVTEGALKLLAKKADGSFRDGIKLLDQLASSGSEITEDQVNLLLGVSSFETTLSILKALASKNTKDVLSALNKQLETGMGVKEFLLTLMENLRALVLIKSELGEVLVKEEIGSDRYQELLELTDVFTIKDLIRGLDIFQEAFEKLKVASIQSLPIELAVVEICQDLKVEDRGLKIVVENKDSKIEAKQIHPQSSTVKEPPSIVHHPSSTSISNSIEKKTHEISISPDIIKIQEKWTFLLETVRQENYSLEALLRNAKVADCVEGKVLIEVPYAFHQRILESPKSKDLIEAILADILGKNVQIATFIGQRPQKVEDIANIEVAPDDEVISMAAEIFQGKIVD